MILDARDELPLSVQLLPHTDRVSLAKGMHLAARLMDDWRYGMAGREAEWTRLLVRRLEQVAVKMEVPK